MSERHGRSLPVVFDRLAVFLAVQAHVLAVIGIAGSADLYRSVPAALAVALASLLVPLGCVVLARRAGGGLSDPAIVVAGAALLLVTAAQALVLPRAELGSPAAFAWGTTGVSALICAAYRPARDVTVLAGVISLAALVMVLPAVIAGHAPRFELLSTLSATVIPGLAAAQYLQRYAVARTRHQQVVADNAAEAAHLAAADLVRRDARSRLELLNVELVPLLTRVADGRVALRDAGLAADARRLAEALRRELLDTHRGAWLLDVSGGADGGGPDDWPGVLVLDPDRILADLVDADRAGLAVLLSALRRHPGFAQVSVALSASGAASTASTAPRGAGAVRVTVVALGPAAARAVLDPLVHAAGEGLGARPDLEDDALVLDMVLAAWPHDLAGGSR